MKLVASCGSHRVQPVFNGCSRAVIFCKIEVRPFQKGIAAHQCLQDPNDLRPFFINGRGVEIVDFDKAFGVHRMSEGPRILGELSRSKCLDIFDSLNGTGALIGRKLLIPEYCEAFFEGQLKPVAAGDTVARPIVEIFMRDNGFNGFIIGIGRGRLIRQQKRRIKDIEALVFHRPEIEVRDGHNIEHV